MMSAVFRWFGRAFATTLAFWLIAVMAIALIAESVVSSLADPGFYVDRLRNARAYETILDETATPAVYVLTMLARQVRLLLIANDMLSRGARQEEIGARLRLSGWVLNKTLQQSRRLSAEYLRYAHAQLVETDLALKTRPIEERLALETLVADLTMRR